MDGTSATVAVHDLSGPDGRARSGEVARAAVAAYGCGPDCTVELLSLSENATFLVHDPHRGHTILRVHRLGYHSPGEIASELAWMDALRDEAGVRTPRVVPTERGERVLRHRGRCCVMFELLPGAAPGPRNAVAFEALGEVTARMHLHARSWRRPTGFTRFRWDLGAAFEEARWGRWQDGVGVGAAEAAILGRLEQALRRRLGTFGDGPERFGLVHADTRLANLLVDPQGVRVIDFDDCGFSWYLYDLATTFSFFEHEPHVPDLIDRWLTGYRRAAALATEDEQEIWTLLLFRRLLLVAWVGSHRGADGAGELGAWFTAGSCELAEAWLSRCG